MSEKIVPCSFCCNAFVDEDLCHDNDLSYKCIGDSAAGYQAYIRSGDRRGVVILFQARAKTWHSVGVYVPKFCPECGRRLEENSLPCVSPFHT